MKLLTINKILVKRGAPAQRREGICVVSFRVSSDTRSCANQLGFIFWRNTPFKMRNRMLTKPWVRSEVVKWFKSSTTCRMHSAGSPIWYSNLTSLHQCPYPLLRALPATHIATHTVSCTASSAYRWQVLSWNLIAVVLFVKLLRTSSIPTNKLPPLFYNR